MRKKIETVIVFFIIIAVLFSLFIYSNDVIEGVTFGFDIWKNNLFPSIFPFLIFANIFINYGVSDVISELTKPILSNILNIDEKCNFIIILSLLSGFPSSSKYIYDSYQNNEISEEDARYLLYFCFFSNPLFIIGTVGLILLGNKKIGILILISHYLSNFILAYLIRNKIKRKSKVNIRNAFSKMKRKIAKSKKFGEVLKIAVLNAINTLLLLLGIITIFLILVNIFSSIISLNDLDKGIISGILEMTSGIRQISNLNINLNLKLSILVGLLSFGGISIHMQILAMLEDFNLEYKKFLIYRLFAVIISIFLINIFSFIFLT